MCCRPLLASLAATPLLTPSPSKHIHISMHCSDLIHRPPTTAPSSALLLLPPRRYNNVVMDDERKAQVEVFLGVKGRSYFPTLHLQYR